MSLRPIGAWILALAATLALPGAAIAQPTGLEPAIGNTIVSTHPDGRQARLQLRSDHTFLAQGRAGNRSTGTWRVRGGRLCLTQRRPMAIPFAYCRRIPSVTPGRPWSDTAVNGDRVVNRIVLGH